MSLIIKMFAIFSHTVNIFYYFIKSYAFKASKLFETITIMRVAFFYGPKLKKYIDK
jgi:hypothetical protein